MIDASFLRPRLVRPLFLKMAWRGGGKEGDGERRSSKLGDDGSAAGSAALFASAVTIFTSIAFNSSGKANALLTPVFLLMGVCHDCLCWRCS
jgi:hypothetical protein